MGSARLRANTAGSTHQRASSTGRACPEESSTGGAHGRASSTGSSASWASLTGRTPAQASQTGSASSKKTQLHAHLFQRALDPSEQGPARRQRWSQSPVFARGEMGHWISRPRRRQTHPDVAQEERQDSYLLKAGLMAQQSAHQACSKTFE